MNDWATPPEFGYNGSNPPIRSALKRVPDVFFGRTQTDTRRSAVKHLIPVEYSEGSEFHEVQKWLAENSHNPEYLGVEHERHARRSKVIHRASLPLLFFPPTFFFGVGAQIGAFAGPYIESRREILRIRRDTFWDRTDPPTYLAPGVISSLATKYSAGISTTAATELVETVGLESGIGASIPGIGKVSSKVRSEMTAKFVASITRTETIDISRTIRITNPHIDRNRIVAVWRPGNLLQIERLRRAGDDLQWQKIRCYEYFTDADLATTSFDTVV